MTAEVPERTSELAAARPVGGSALSDALRYSRQAGHWHPAGFPEKSSLITVVTTSGPGTAGRSSPCRPWTSRWSSWPLETATAQADGARERVTGGMPLRRRRQIR